MPRRKTTVDESPRRQLGKLGDRLVQELRGSRQSGQPVIEEREFPTGKMQVTVIWDAWDHLPLDERSSIIVRAYEVAEGREYRDRIALAGGLTIPEAYAAGMLPFYIIAAVRKNDPVTASQCSEAMIEEGASVLLDPRRPQLRFATEQEAETARQRLIDRLPKSEEVWIIGEEPMRPNGYLEVEAD